MQKPCIICGYPDGQAERKVHEKEAVNMLQTKCPRCGHYYIEYPMNLISESINPEQLDDKTLKSFIGYTREQTIKGNIIHISYKQFDDFIKYTSKQVPKTVLDKIDKLLVNLSRLANNPSSDIELTPAKDYTLGYCNDENEFKYYLKYLDEINYFKKNVGSPGYKITVDGWKKIQDLLIKTQASTQCFVAMWFDPSMDNSYLKIEKAISDAGYKAIRVDKEHYTGDVTDKIITEIRRSKFIVADYTGQRHGVYYEAGFARGLGIETISTCKQDDIKNLHFDTSHLNHIPWETEEELYEKLKDRILAIYGEGPLRNNTNESSNKKTT